MKTTAEDRRSWRHNLMLLPLRPENIRQLDLMDDCDRFEAHLLTIRRMAGRTPTEISLGIIAVVEKALGLGSTMPTDLVSPFEQEP